MQQVDWQQQFEVLVEHQRQKQAQKAGQDFLIDYNHISHVAREQFQLSLTEYCLYDTINTRESTIESREAGGWVASTKQEISSALGVNVRTVERAIKEGLDGNLLEKEERYKFLRTTAAWKKVASYWKENGNSNETKVTGPLVRHTHVYHPVRRFFKLSLEQYCLFEVVRSYEAGSKSQEMGGWIYTKKATLAEVLGLSRASIHNYINLGVQKKLLEKHKHRANLLRTTVLWKNQVLFWDDKIRKKKKPNTNPTPN